MNTLNDEDIEQVIALNVACLESMEIERKNDEIVVYAVSCDDGIKEGEVKEDIVNELGDDYDVEVERKDDAENKSEDAIIAYLDVIIIIAVSFCLCGVLIVFYIYRKRKGHSIENKEMVHGRNG